MLFVNDLNYVQALIEKMQILTLLPWEIELFITNPSNS